MAKIAVKDWRKSRTYKEKVCEVCGSSFISKYRGYKEGWTRYCSVKCSQIVRQKGDYRACQWCSNEFYIPRAHIYRKDKKFRGKFCSRDCFVAWRSTLVGEQTPNWRGGRFVGVNGYVYVRHQGGYRLEHRVIMEQYLGRKLERWEHVHHLNGDRTDNRIENLKLTDRWQHPSMHC